MGAFVIPPLCARIRIPAAVGEIIFGILAGPYVLGWIELNEFTTFLAEFGFAFLMFLVGLEMDFTRIEREGLRGVFSGLGVTALFFIVPLFLTAILELPLFLFLAFSAVSLGILMVTLNEVGMTRSDVGQVMIYVGSFGEFATIILLTAFGFYYRFGIGWQLVEEMGKLALIFIMAYTLLVVLRTLIWWWPNAFSRVVAAKDPSEIGVRAGMATMLVFVALASMMEVEAILGAFVAGALFSFVFREKKVLETKMASLGFGFFVPIFFIWVGAKFNLPSVMHLDILPMLSLFLGISVFSKMVASLPLLARGMGTREVIGSALLFSTPLTMLVVIARIGEEVGVIDQETAAALVLLAIVSSVLLPWLFRIIMRRHISA